MPSGPGDYQDFLRFSNQVGTLLANFANQPFTGGFAASGIYVGNYQTLGVSYGAGGAVGTAYCELHFSDDQAGLIQTGIRFINGDQSAGVVAAVPVTGQYLQYILNADAFPVGALVSFKLTGFTYDIDPVEFEVGFRSQFFDHGVVAAAGFAIGNLSYYVNSTVTFSGWCATGGPAQFEIQQRNSGLFAWLPRIIVPIPAGEKGGTVVGKLDAIPTRIIAQNNTGAAQQLISTMNFGRL